jgi:glycosyltransferase 2 family protein
VTGRPVLAEAVPGETSRSPRPQRWRVVLRTILTWAFFGLVVALLMRLARHIDWAGVFRTLRNIEASTLGLAAMAALGSHLVYASFDVLGKVYTRHHLPISRILPITFVCYVFNLNLSAWVGALAARYRLYSRQGLTGAVIARIVTLSLITNWLGHFALAGALFSSGRVPFPLSEGSGARATGA